MNIPWDAIVIGSGFGGAVTACRMAEGGMNVLVLERGRRWQAADYPRKPDDAWIWDQDNPQSLNGWIDLRITEKMWVAQGAGVGGGSLIYANVSVAAEPWVFDEGWPPEITYRVLEPYYEMVGRMLNVQPLPDNQLTERFKTMKEGAEKLGYGDRFRKLPLAVTFDPNYSYDRSDPTGNQHSEKRTNAQGQEQGTCVHCGNCDIGCQVKAKNTLDLNYIPWAEKHGAIVRPLHMVHAIEPDGGQYHVHFNRIQDGRLIPGRETAARVVVACGSLGSTELLLRCRDQYGFLPHLSKALGANWSSNGDFLTPALYKNRRISPTIGPTITCAIDFLDGSADGRKIFIEDGGFPNLLKDFLSGRRNGITGHYGPILRWLKHFLLVDDPGSEVMPWFGQSVDAADGTLYLGRAWYAPWRRKLKIGWDVAATRPTIDAMVNMHKRLSAATGGNPIVPFTWEDLGILITPHPLGGCGMGRSAHEGVVNHRGEVFGYPNLFVADGAIVPRALGLNPSRTIAALSERIADLIVREHGRNTSQRAS